MAFNCGMKFIVYWGGPGSIPTVATNPSSSHQKEQKMCHHNENQSLENGNWPKIHNVLYAKYTSENEQNPTYLYKVPTSEMSNILQTVSNVSI
jgi:hypothetical protein